MQKVSVLAMDVDGTLTDGKLHISSQGELFKTFHVKDEYGIRVLLAENNIIPVIITGKSSKILEYRAKEMGVQQIYQGVADKAECIRTITASFGFSLKTVACIGDDLNDIPMMQLCGIRGCPRDAVLAVKKLCDYICDTDGGQGAVREFIEWILHTSRS